MSDILQKENRKAGVPKQKKAYLRVDLTPMVDLGFLLISFFIFTTAIAQPTVMKLALPDDSIDSSKAPENKTLNIILGAGNKIFMYNGTAINEVKNVAGRNALRAAIFQKKQQIQNHFRSDTGMVVLIKPMPASTYGNVVNALDEMLISNVKTYILMEPNAAELQVINNLN